MLVYRICRAPFKQIDGEGARLYGGRWNNAGRPVVYASSSLALAALEYLVHVEPADVPNDLVAQTIDVPDDLLVKETDSQSLVSDWAQSTGSPGCQAVGDAWLSEATYAVLRVPAAPIPEESNVLLNPRHPDASRWSVVAERPFTYDPRLLP